jgi:SAM-dependent methyltransferase
VSGASSEFREWDDWYARRDYRRMPWFSPRPSPWVVNSVRDRHFRPDDRILDVGCGTGSTLLWLSRHGFRVSGIDVSPIAIRIAASRAHRARLPLDVRVASADRIPYPRRFFDDAIDSGCFHSLPLEIRERYAQEIARVLRPEGRLLLTWIPREVQTSMGLPHRPSLTEVTAVLEPWFVFAEVRWYASGSPEGWNVLGARMGRCTALLTRRRGRQPPAR